MAMEPPIVYVKEPLAWEYKDLARDLSDGDTLSVDELNNLDKEGWELAGVFRRYSNDAELLRLEAEAKQEGLGLWVAPNPIPPWEWRRGRRE